MEKSFFQSVYKGKWTRNHMQIIIWKAKRVNQRINFIRIRVKNVFEEKILFHSYRTVTTVGYQMMEQQGAIKIVDIHKKYLMKFNTLCLAEIQIFLAHY